MSGTDAVALPSGAVNGRSAIEPGSWAARPPRAVFAIRRRRASWPAFWAALAFRALRPKLRTTRLAPFALTSTRRLPRRALHLLALLRTEVGVALAARASSAPVSAGERPPALTRA